MSAIEKRAWSELQSRSNKKRRTCNWIKELKKLSPERCENLIKYAKQLGV